MCPCVTICYNLHHAILKKILVRYEFNCAIHHSSVYISASERPFGIVPEPVTPDQRLENLRVCLTHLTQHGVDTASVQAAGE